MNKAFCKKNLSAEDKKQICSWRYEGEYSVYNLPSYDELKLKNTSLFDSEKDKEYTAFYSKGELIGYSRITQKQDGVYIGVGVAPAHCGKGYGQKIVKLTVQKARAGYPQTLLYMEVRVWNQRAIHCYKKCGFEIVGKEYGKETANGTALFIRMRLYTGAFELE